MPDQNERQTMIATIRNFPDVLEELVSGLTPAQLTARPLEGEWSIAQNVHHLVDSHANSYIRFKLVMTEENPTLRGYNQDDWAELPDAAKADISDSLTILRGLHARWAAFLDNLQEDDWQRGGTHTESGPMTIDSMLVTYHNHCNAHIDQITRTLAAQE